MEVIKECDIIPLHELEILQNKEMQNKLQLLQCTDRWNSFQCGCNVIRKIHIPTLRDYHFNKNYMRYVDHDVKNCWKMKLKPGPHIDHISQCPIPGNLLETHRTLKENNRKLLRKVEKDQENT